MFDRATAKAYEGLFTQGWSWVHVRGSYEQAVPGEVQDAAYERRAANVTSEKFRERVSKWGCYVPGVFGPHPTLNSEMVNLPWPLELRVVVDGVELAPGCGMETGPAGMETNEGRGACAPRGVVESDQRRLHLGIGLLARDVTWRVGEKLIHLTFARSVSIVHEGMIHQSISIRADQPCEAEVIAGLDARVRTNGHDHFESVSFYEYDGWIVCDVCTDGGDLVREACCVDAGALAKTSHVEERRGGWHVRLQVGAELQTIEKLTLVRRGKAKLPNFREPIHNLRAESYCALEGEWKYCDVEIEGDDDSQLAMRAALYHLIRAHPRTSAVAIDAKGYAGEAYWGRFFWDTEAYLLPFYAHTHPDLARRLCAFRVHTLDGARANAQRYGYAGARYAWESDHRGIECCPNWQYADHEVHVTADVVYGFEHYARATGDEAFVSEAARETVVETARYWLGRVSKRVGDERVHLLGVMGPDEYTPISSNNAYTNRMVQRALELASRLAEDRAERAAFASAARGLWLPRDGELVLQCEEWALFGEPEFDRTWADRARTYAAQVSQERLYRSKCLKQADVLMLMALLPHEFSNAEVAAAWRAYVPYTTHDSSLSPGAHALVALRLGLHEEAWAFWQRGKGLDLDVWHGGAAEGIHIAACGAMWQMAVYGFAGVKSAMETDVLTIGPRLPAQWAALRFPLYWRGSRVRVEIDRGRVRVSHLGGSGLDVEVCGQRRHVDEEASAEWSMR